MKQRLLEALRIVKLIFEDYPRSSFFLLFVLMMLLGLVNYSSLWYCRLGMGNCIVSQGTQIHSKKVIEILDRCREFIDKDAGLKALLMDDIAEHIQRYGHTPLVRAWFAIEDIERSPLQFARKLHADPTKYYLEIKHSCQRLERDFYDVDKWTTK
jgi:hypothetical protein